ncbi:MAG: NUDIX hydrolase [Bacteroidota bacterium]|jgi:8-oxo-dGTP pyrophosphatase MutT (NUDIX family)|nr:NUDIX domain-containing protein [Terrimonas sp.]
MEKKIIAGGGVVVNENNQVLFIYRRKKWDLPKGKLDPGEDIKACAIREVMEETGIRNLTIGNLIIVTTHSYEENGMNMQKETHWFEMKASTVDNSTLTPQLEEDIEKIEWVSPENLEEYLSETYTTIQQVLNSWNRPRNHIW